MPVEEDDDDWDEDDYDVEIILSALTGQRRPTCGCAFHP